MSVQISQLPNITSTQLTSGTTTSLSVPLIASVASGNVTTYQTSFSNVKTYIQTGNLNLTGAISANLTSTVANLTVTGNLNVIGTTTSTSSQNLSSNSSIIDLHTFSSNLDPWTSDDGRDIGFRFYYYKNGVASTAALYRQNNTGYLVFAGALAGNANTGVISGGATLGSMQVGQMFVSNATATTANGTGALQVGGGISAGGNLWVVGNATVGNISASSGSGTFSSANFLNNVTVGGTLIATGKITSASHDVNTFVTVGTTLVTSGNTTVNGLTVNNSVTIGSTLGVTGNFISGSIAAAAINSNANVTASALTVNNSATIGSSLFVNGTTLAQSIIPITANTYTIGNSTNWFTTVYATAMQSQYADLAEKYISDSQYSPGTVVIFGGSQEITTTTILADTRVAGVISTDPAYLMNGESTGLPVALRGKVPVNVIGQVSKGDPLVTSTEPGYAVSAAFTDVKGHSIFAKSLVDDRGHEKRQIMAVIL